jgi:hypothetical protein
MEVRSDNEEAENVVRRTEKSTLFNKTGTTSTIHLDPTAMRSTKTVMRRSPRSASGKTGFMLIV